MAEDAAAAAAAAATATAAAEATAAAAAAANQTAWHSGFEGDTLGYIQNRGLDKLDANGALTATIQAHKEAEKMLGAPADKVLRMPEPNDVDGWAKFHTALGRPADAAGYNMEGVEEKVAGVVREQAFRLGLSADKGRELAKSLNDFAVKEAADKTEAAAQQLQVSQAALKADWGPSEFDAKMQVSRSAAKALNVSEDALNALEAQLGYQQVMNMFLNIGSKIGEDKFVRTDHSLSLVTREGATAQITALTSDKDFVKKYQSGDVDANAKMSALMAIAHGDING